MPARDILMSAAGVGGGEAANYIEDVFSTYLYTGTSASQTITNGIDLAGKGGFVWTKSRSNTSNQYLVYSNGSSLYGLYPNLTNAAGPAGPPSGHVFNNNGFTIDGSSGLFNFSGYTYASWTFAEQEKFFDVVTFTATGSSQAISHSLASTPGMIFFKRTDGASNWLVWNRTYPAQYYQTLNTTAAAADLGAVWCTPTSTNVTVDVVFGAGQTWVAYLFAHNAGGFGTSGTDNVISCGSYTGNGSSTGPSITLGYEPQYVMIKASSISQDWFVADVMRGMPVGTGDAYLIPNTSDAEAVGNYIAPTATGFNITSAGSSFNGSGETYIYMAIRRPMKVPTTGTSVFSPIISSASINTKLTTGFPVDLQWGALRNGNSDNFQTIDRLRKISTDSTENGGNYLRTTTTNAEATAATQRSNFWDNTGFRMFGWWEGSNTLFYNFSRRPGFFDEVCYTGTGSATTQAHNLGVAPELMIIKSRSNSTYWGVYSASLGATQSIYLNDPGAAASGGSTLWNSTAPTSSVFTVGTSSLSTNYSGYTYVAYLFATCAGVSKVGSYTGTGATQTINCGFTGGARFVLIKRTDDIGDWWVWDTVRGMVSGTDPRLSMNDGLVGVGEINENWVYTATTGFQIVTTDASVNASGGSYIYLAIA